jgi:transcriptional regulator with XRE-family HTH domain
MRQGNIIGERIHLLRQLRGWTQQKFARKLRNAGQNVSRDVVARWETCETPIIDARLPVIASLLRVAIVDLFPRKRRGRPRTN